MACRCQECGKPCDCGEKYCWAHLWERDETVKNMMAGGRFHGVKLLNEERNELDDRLHSGKC